jgi:hypothetical protein
MVMINFHAKLKPALKNKAKSFFAPSAATTSASPDKCTNQEGCPMYQSSFFTLEPNLSTIGRVSTNTSNLILTEKMIRRLQSKELYCCSKDLHR